MWEAFADKLDMVGIDTNSAITMPDAADGTEYVDAAKYIGVQGFPGAPGDMVHEAGANTAKYTTRKTSKNPYASNHAYMHTSKTFLSTTFRLHITCKQRWRMGRQRALRSCTSTLNVDSSIGFNSITHQRCSKGK